MSDKPLHYDAEEGVQFPSKANPEYPEWRAAYVQTLREVYCQDGAELVPFQLEVGQATPFNDIHKAERRDMYQRMMADGEEVPPVVVEKSEDGWQVLDGSHRLDAARRAGVKWLPAFELVKGVYYRGVRNPKGGTRLSSESWTTSPDIAGIYSSTPPSTFRQKPEWKPGANVQRAEFEMKNPLVLEKPHMSFGELMEKLGHRTHPNGISDEDSLKMLNYLVNQKKKGNPFKYRVTDEDGNEVEEEDLGISLFSLPRSSLHEYRDSWKDLLAHNHALAKDWLKTQGNALSVDTYALVDSPAFRRAAEKMGFDGVSHADVFDAAKEAATNLYGKPLENLEGVEYHKWSDPQYTHMTHRPFFQVAPPNVVNRIGKSEDLEKGVKQRLWPVNVQEEYDSIPPKKQRALKDWIEGDGDNVERNAIPEMTGNFRQRALLSLHSLTKVRRNPQTGEREFLLHRGVGPYEYKNGYHYEAKHNTSWTPVERVAAEFSYNYGDSARGEDRFGPDGNLAGKFPDEGPPSQYISAWIPESHIHSVPSAYGKLATGHDFGVAKFAGEHEVVVKPGVRKGRWTQFNTPDEMDAHSTTLPRLERVDTGKVLQGALSPEVQKSEGSWVEHPELPKRIQKMFDAVRYNLDEPLRKPKYRDHPNKYKGHCYVATEALYHLINGKETGWKVKHIQHEGDTHWFLYHPNHDTVLDPTAEQFKTRVPYEEAKSGFFLTGMVPSKRARELIAKVRDNGTLKKGVMQRIAPFHPTDIPKKDRESIGAWQDVADPYIREQIKPMTGALRQRALHRLHAVTETRRHPLTGEREFLLHRGMGHKEAGDTTEEGYFNGGRSSWTPSFDVANEHFGEEGNGYATGSAWIPESAIVHVPLMAGWIENDEGFGPKLGAGPNDRTDEWEVIVHPTGDFPYEWHKGRDPLVKADEPERIKLSGKFHEPAPDPKVAIKRPTKRIDLRDIKPPEKPKYRSGYDYSHVLPKNLRDKYEIEVRDSVHSGRPEGYMYSSDSLHGDFREGIKRYPELKQMSVRIYRKGPAPGTRVYNRDPNRPDDPTENQPDLTLYGEHLDGKTIEPHIGDLLHWRSAGVAVYGLQALLAHARNHHKLKRLRVPPHSVKAHNLIQRYMELLGIKYRGKQIDNPRYMDDDFPQVAGDRHMYSGQVNILKAEDAGYHIYEFDNEDAS